MIVLWLLQPYQGVRTDAWKFKFLQPTYTSVLRWFHFVTIELAWVWIFTCGVYPKEKITLILILILLVIMTNFQGHSCAEIIIYTCSSLCDILNFIGSPLLKENYPSIVIVLLHYWSEHFWWIVGRTWWFHYFRKGGWNFSSCCGVSGGLVSNLYKDILFYGYQCNCCWLGCRKKWTGTDHCVFPLVL